MKVSIAMIFILMILGCSQKYAPPQIQKVQEKKKETKKKEAKKKEAKKKEAKKKEAKKKEAKKKAYTLPKKIQEKGLKLLAGDVIQISVSEEQDLTRQYTIPEDGILFFPLIKKIKVIGKTNRQITFELIKNLRRFIVNPIVNVSIISLHERKVYIYGIRGGSKAVTLSPNKTTTLSQILIGAGIPEDADLSAISLIRTYSGGKRKAFTIPLHNLFEKSEIKHDVEVQADDLIIIKKNPQVFVQGSVKSPGAIKIRSYEKKSLWEVFSLVGGATDNADLDKIRIIRKTGDNRAKLITTSLSDKKLGKSESVEAGDIVIVPSQAQTRNYVTIYGEINRPGVVLLARATERISTIIAKSGGLTQYASSTISVFRYKDGKEEKKFYLNYKAIVSGDAKHDIEVKPGDVIFIDSSIL